jgi:hypothetical protein
MASYEDKYQGKLWPNEDKKSPSDPDFKGTVNTVADLEAVSKMVDGKKQIDYSAIPSEKKLSISLWKNQGKDGKTTLNIKIAKKNESDDNIPF